MNYILIDKQVQDELKRFNVWLSKAIAWKQIEVIDSSYWFAFIYDGKEITITPTNVIVKQWKSEISTPHLRYNIQHVLSLIIK